VYPLTTGPAHSAIAKRTIAKLERARTEIEAVLAQLRRIAPPRPAAAEHRQIENGVARVGVDMGTVITALRDGDVEAAMEPAALPSLQDVTDATDRLERKGYDVLGRSASTGSS